jgi:hypothetical protein
MSTDEPGKKDKRTPWIIAAFAIILAAIATYMNYGGHHFG